MLHCLSISHGRDQPDCAHITNQRWFRIQQLEKLRENYQNNSQRIRDNYSMQVTFTKPVQIHIAMHWGKLTTNLSGWKNERTLFKLEGGQSSGQWKLSNSQGPILGPGTFLPPSRSLIHFKDQVEQRDQVYSPSIDFGGRDFWLVMVKS